MISKPAQRFKIQLQAAAGQARKQRNAALSQARTPRRSAPPELGPGGAALPAAPPQPRTEARGCRFPR
eukprot:824059-Alexandrium_andersonii.AAC.1